MRKATLEAGEFLLFWKQQLLALNCLCSSTPFFITASPISRASTKRQNYGLIYFCLTMAERIMQNKQATDEALKTQCT